MNLCFLLRHSVAIPVFAAVLPLLTATDSHAITSPYVTTQVDVPLNQAADDDVNGMVPVGSHTPLEGGSISRLTDATSPTAPTANVILGPDNTWVGVTWDFGGTAEEIAGRRLDRIDLWIAAFDDLRKGYRGDFSVSLTGDVNDFTVIPNSEHWAGLSQNGQFNLVRYEFPTEFVAGDDPDGRQDRHPVQNFRYLRFNSRGDGIGGTDWQPRFVEIDIWTSHVPSTGPSFSLTPLPWSAEGHFRMRLNGQPGTGYVLQASENLTDWTAIDWGWTDAEGGYDFTDTSAPTFSRRFYRAEPY